VSPAKITDINVVQTIKEGKSIFKLSSPRAYTPVSMSDHRVRQYPRQFHPRAYTLVSMNDHHHETGQQKPLSKSQQKIVARLVQSAQ
jgi:acyl CoA:acetate/3-ketoacid CoA transferase